MPTLVRDPQPYEFEQLLARRRKLGLDRFDEVWEGVYHMNPAPNYGHQRLSQQLAVIFDPLARAAGLEAVVGGVNIGVQDDFRIPDGSLHWPGTEGVYLATAVLAYEILSPGDDTREKLPFYAAHEIAELVIVDPRAQAIEWLALTPTGAYRPIDRSTTVEMSAGELARLIDWPAPTG